MKTSTPPSLYVVTTAACIVAASCSGSHSASDAACEVLDGLIPDAHRPAADAASDAAVSTPLDAGVACGPELQHPLIDRLSPSVQISGGTVAIVGFGLVGHRADGSYPGEGAILDNGTRAFFRNREGTEVLDIAPLTVGARDRACLEHVTFVVPARAGTSWGPTEEVMLVVQRNGISEVETFIYDD